MAIYHLLPNFRVHLLAAVPDETLDRLSRLVLFLPFSCTKQ